VHTAGETCLQKLTPAHPDISISDQNTKTTT